MSYSSCQPTLQVSAVNGVTSVLGWSVEKSEWYEISSGVFSLQTQPYYQYSSGLQNSDKFLNFGWGSETWKKLQNLFNSIQKMTQKFSFTQKVYFCNR